jgi:large subunit ribosomal protein L23
MPKAIHVYEVLRRPIVTEKSTMLAGQGKYVFEVAKQANKPQIHAAVEQAFNVTVTAVNTTIVRGRRKRNRAGKRAGTPPSWKKAIVTLKDGDQIQLFEGV